MYCNKCGADLPEGRQFCDRCGAAVNAGQNGSCGTGQGRIYNGGQNAGQRQTYNTGQSRMYNSGQNAGQRQIYNAASSGNQSMFNEAPAAQIYSANGPSLNGQGSFRRAAGVNSPVAALKQDIVSKQFLIAMVLFSFFAFWSLIQAFAGGSVYSIVQENIYSLGVSMSGMLGLAKFMDVVSSIPNLVLAAGLWLIYLPAKDLNSPHFKTTGFSILKIMIIIQAVIYALTIVVMDIVLFIFASWAYEGAAFYVAMAVVMAGVGVVMVLYYFKLAKTVGNFKDVAEGIVQRAQISMYVVVICVIMAVSGVISAVSDFTSFSSFFALVSGLAAIADAWSYAYFTNMLMKYRKKNKAMGI